MSLPEFLAFPPDPPMPVELRVPVSEVQLSSVFKSKGFTFGHHGGGACGPLSGELANGNRRQRRASHILQLCRHCVMGIAPHPSLGE